MVLNQENQNYIEPNSFKAKSLNWQWEKKHWLLVISLACLVLWWFGSQIKESTWIRSVINYLPVIGGMAFAADSIIKLI